jgi:hypothetical protein
MKRLLSLLGIFVVGFSLLMTYHFLSLAFVHANDVLMWYEKCAEIPHEFSLAMIFFALINQCICMWAFGLIFGRERIRFVLFSLAIEMLADLLMLLYVII